MINVQPNKTIIWKPLPAFRNLQCVNLDDGRTISSDGYYVYHS